MREAIRLSHRAARRDEGGPFGAVVVRRGEIVSRGWNQVTSKNDPTAHAEVMAIRAACRKLHTFSLSDCVLYSSCEPCPMCLAAIYWARIKTLYFANTRHDATRIGFDDAAFYRELKSPTSRRKMIMRPLLRDEALEVFNAWDQKEDRVRY
jgi:guanine deaminase